MAFFNSAVQVLQTLVVALGAGLGIWGAINLMEGYGNDNPGELLTRSIRSCEECFGIGDHSHCGPDPHVHRLL